MDVEAAVLGSPSPIVPTVSADQRYYSNINSCGRKAASELMSCVDVEAAVLGSPSLTVPTLSMDQRYFSNIIFVWM